MHGASSAAELALEQAVVLAKSAADRVAALNDLAWALRHAAPARSRVLARDALDTVRSGELADPDRSQGIATALTTLGFLDWIQGKPDVALDECLEARLLLQALPVCRASVDCRRMIAWIQFSVGDIVRSLETGNEALRLAAQLPDRRQEAAVLDAVAIIRSAAGESDEARHLNAQAMAIARSVRDPMLEATTLNNRAVIELRSGDPAAALATARAALVLARAEEAVDQQVAILDTIGEACQALGDLAGATEVLHDAQQLSEDGRAVHLDPGTILDLGRAHLRAGNTAEAERLCRAALAQAEVTRAPAVEADARRTLVDLLERRGPLPKRWRSCARPTTARSG